MSSNWEILFIPLIVFTTILIGISVKFFKNRKRSAESIYKLIADLEKKYIY